MRLAVINHVGDTPAGAEHALLEFVTRLPVDVEPSFYFFEDGRFAASIRERFGAVTIVPMPARIAAISRGKMPLAALPASAALVYRLAKELKLARPDVVLTNSMKAHVIGSVAAKLAGLRCTNYVHDFVTGPARAVLQIVSQLCAQERMVCSKAVGANLAMARTTAIYPSIDTTAFSELPDRRTARLALGLPDDGLPVVGLVGRIARWKGQDRFIRIALDVLRDTDAHFAIVGSPVLGCDPHYVPELEAAVSAANMESRIHFIPWQTDMRGVYAALDIACNCSTREPFGRTSLEALASGVPIVCFDDGGSPEILAGRHCGTTVRAGDEIAFAAAVRAYLSYPQLMSNAKELCRGVAAGFDITKTARQFEAVIARVGTA